MEVNTDNCSKIVIIYCQPLPPPHPGLTFSGKAKGLPLLWGLVRYSTREGSNLAYKYYPIVDVTNIDEYSYLLWHRINYDRKKFYSTSNS